MSPNKDDESVRDADDETSPAEIGRDAKSLSHVRSVSIHWDAPLPQPAYGERRDGLRASLDAVEGAYHKGSESCDRRSDKKERIDYSWGT